MKTHFKIFAGIVATAFIISGCTPVVYSQPDNGYYSSAYGYDDSYEYGDGPWANNYGYNQSLDDYDRQGYQYQPTVSFNDFYNQLSPHGIWVNIAPYGQVWVANVRNFQPYSTNGYWAYTNYGWTWVSDYSWGWAPFHYGRWGYNNRYGWYWVPGYTWGPAWVAWGSGTDMYGWAPLMPGMNYSVNLSVNLFPSSYWTFMPRRYMGNTNIGGYYVDRSRNVTIIKNTTIINNYGTEGNNHRRYSMGPSATDVQRSTGRSIQPMRVTNAQDSRSTGVNNNELRVYRPVASPDAMHNRTGNPANNNRTGAPQTRTQSDQTDNRSATPHSRTRPDQSTDNRSATPHTRTQPDQSTDNRSATPQTRTRPDQSTDNRSATPHTRTQPDQSTTTQRTVESREYRQNPAQQRVTNSAAPQTTKQIQTAQRDNTRTQQRSSSTPAKR